MFGSPVLKVGGKVFAMLVKGRLVVKLPKERVERLVASGTGKPFDPGHGRPSKEWVAVDSGASRR
jgi:TfoX/Sxy family transcriptional regulator of competence genes